LDEDNQVRKNKKAPGCSRKKHEKQDAVVRCAARLTKPGSASPLSPPSLAPTTQD